MIFNKNKKAKLRAKRARLNMTQKEVADLLGINVVTYATLENPDKPSKPQRKIAEKVIDWLLEDVQ
jgi:DNA-binding XRE family transcriptional regulator